MLDDAYRLSKYNKLDPMAFVTLTAALGTRSEVDLTSWSTGLAALFNMHKLLATAAARQASSGGGGKGSGLMSPAEAGGG